VSTDTAQFKIITTALTAGEDYNVLVVGRSGTGGSYRLLNEGP
jgi:hypothetical protein